MRPFEEGLARSISSRAGSIFRSSGEAMAAGFGVTASSFTRSGFGAKRLGSAAAPDETIATAAAKPCHSLIARAPMSCLLGRCPAAASR